MPLSELGEQLDPDEFAQIHRSVIVNLNAVAATRRDLTGKLYVRIRDTRASCPSRASTCICFRQM